MKFILFTNEGDRGKMAINVDAVDYVYEFEDSDRTRTVIYLKGSRDGIYVEEDFDIVFSRLNTVAEFKGGCHG